MERNNFFGKGKGSARSFIVAVCPLGTQQTHIFMRRQKEGEDHSLEESILTRKGLEAFCPNATIVMFCFVAPFC